MHAQSLAVHRPWSDAETMIYRERILILQEVVRSFFLLLLLLLLGLVVRGSDTGVFSTPLIASQIDALFAWFGLGFGFCFQHGCF